MTSPTLSLRIDRSGLGIGLPPLVISRDPAQGLWLPEDGLARPDFQFRYTYAPDARWVSGRQLLDATLDQADIPLVVYVGGDDATQVAARESELEAAVSQWAYEVTLDIDGVTRTWQADPAWPTWGAVDAGMLRAHMSRASLTIPVNPNGA